MEEELERLRIENQKLREILAKALNDAETGMRYGEGGRLSFDELPYVQEARKLGIVIPE